MSDKAPLQTPLRHRPSRRRMLRLRRRADARREGRRRDHRPLLHRRPGRHQPRRRSLRRAPGRDAPRGVCGVLQDPRRHPHELLDYQDAQLEFANFSEAAAHAGRAHPPREVRRRAHLRRRRRDEHARRPHHGLRFTTAAFHWAASPKRFPTLGPIHTAQRLYYNTTHFFFPGRPAPLPAPWTVTLDVTRVQQRKFEAFRAHTSQLPLMEKFQGSSSSTSARRSTR